MFCFGGYFRKIIFKCSINEREKLFSMIKMSKKFDASNETTRKLTVATSHFKNGKLALTSYFLTPSGVSRTKKIAPQLTAKSAIKITSSIRPETRGQRSTRQSDNQTSVGIAPNFFQPAHFGVHLSRLSSRDRKRIHPGLGFFPACRNFKFSSPEFRQRSEQTSQTLL